MRSVIFITLVLVLSGPAYGQQQRSITPEHVTVDTLRLMDTARQRSIPVAFYDDPANGKQKPVVIISHGYNNNQPGSYLDYSSLAKFLAASGYFVVSIQHELPTDSLLPTTGNPRETRWTNWARGAENIRFVLHTLPTIKLRLNYRHVVLIGHSNGGDMSVLFAHRYAAEVEKVITLDNRRMEFPRVAHPAFLTLRSSDFPADDGVLPTAEEQRHHRMKIRIIKLEHTRHGEMSDVGTEAQRAEINSYILDFLQH